VKFVKFVDKSGSPRRSASQPCPRVVNGTEMIVSMSSKTTKNPHYSKTKHIFFKPLKNRGQIYHRFVLASK